jgi:hypothetical protein
MRFTDIPKWENQFRDINQRAPIKRFLVSVRPCAVSLGPLDAGTVDTGQHAPQDIMTRGERQWLSSYPCPIQAEDCITSVPGVAESGRYMHE